jgi:hypothetical protein
MAYMRAANIISDGTFPEIVNVLGTDDDAIRVDHLLPPEPPLPGLPPPCEPGLSHRLRQPLAGAHGGGGLLQLPLSRQTSPDC